MRRWVFGDGARGAPSRRYRADWIPAYAGMTVNVGAAMRGRGATLTLALSQRERVIFAVVRRIRIAAAHTGGIIVTCWGREGDAGGVAGA